MKRRIFALFLTVCMVLTMLPAVGFAAETASGTCGENLTWSLEGGTLTISGTGAMPNDWYSSDIPWYSSQDAITSVVIEDGVTSIGSLAFFQCTNLTSVEIPASVTYIGHSAFNNCSSLTSVTIPDGVTELGDYAFYYSGLTSVTIPASVTKVGFYAFCSTGLKAITFRGDAPVFDNVDDQDNWGYDGDPVIFSKVNAIAYYPGSNATWTSDVRQSYGGTILWVDSDSGASNIVHHGTCGDSLTWTIDDQGVMTISGSGELEDGWYNDDAPWYSVRESITSVVIDADISYIGSYAFHNCSNLTSIQIPGTVTRIGDYAFRGCESLTAVDIPDAVTYIGEFAFSHCGSMTAAEIPSGIQELGASAFEYCASLTNMVVPEAITELSGTFRGCSSLASVTLPSGLTAIYDGAFNGCASLTSLDIPASVEELGSYTFQNCTGLTSLSLPGGITAIGSHTFSGCTNLTTVNIPEGVTYIGDYAFENCATLTGVTIPEKVKTIEDSAFYGCAALTSVTVSETVYTFGESVFENCTGLTNVVIENGVGSVSAAAFKGCTGLTRVELPISVSKIGAEAFSGCTGLTEISFRGDAPEFAGDTFTNVTATVSYPTGNTTWTEDVMQNYGGTLTWTAFDPASIQLASGTCGENLTWVLNGAGTITISGTGPMTEFGSWKYVPWLTYQEHITTAVVEEGVTTIGSGAFSSCPNLQTVSLPSTLEAIGSLAFSGSALTSVDIPGTVTSIGDFAFSGCSELTSAVLPAGLTSLGEFVFNGSAITSAQIPAGITELPYGSFANCVNLREVTFQEGLRTLGGSAFNGCTALETVTIPSTVTLVDDQAFLGCTALKEVYFLGNAPQFGEAAFGDVTATVYYPINNATWTEAVLQNYYGSLTWVTHCPGGHSYADNVCTKCGALKITAPVVTVSNVADSGKVRISWDPVENAASYHVYHSSSKNGPFTLLAVIPGTAMDHTAAVPGTSNYYYVLAQHADGDLSHASSTVHRTCDLAQPTVSLSNVASSGKIRISWNDVEGAAKYRIYVSTSENGTYRLLSTTTKTSIVNISAETGQTYYYKVRAISDNTAAHSVYSDVHACVCDCARPTVSVSNVASSGKIRISWNAVKGAVKYQVYVSDAKDGTYRLLSTTAKTSIVNTSAVAGMTYYYKVRAIAENTSANSAYSSAKIRACDLAQPTVSVSNVASTGKIRIKWNAVEGAVKYRVYVATSKNGPFRLLSTTAKTSIVNTSAVGGTTYFYKVRAIAENSSSNSAYSAVKMRACDLAQPTAQADSTSTSAITISWNEVPGAVSYKIARAAGEDGVYSSVSTVTGLSYTDQAVEAGAAYSYKVTAMSSASAASSAASKAVTATAAPMAPVMKTSAQADASAITISWSKTDSADGYTIYRRTSTSKDWTEIASVTSGDTTSYTDTGRSGRYYYCVAAFTTEDGTRYTGSQSAAIRARTLAAPENVTFDHSNTATSVAWPDIAGATAYEICYSADGESWTLLDSISDEPGYLHEIKNSSGYYKVRAIYTYNGVTTYGPYQESFVVIALDPGHGGTVCGAAATFNGTEYLEADLNWKIANYCKDYLESAYSNVIVHLTRAEDENPSHQERVDRAVAQNADFLLSLHLNSATGGAQGTEILIPQGIYNPEQGAASRSAASSILDKLVAMGLRSRGLLTDNQCSSVYPDGTRADAYFLIRYGVLADLPTIIVEQCFMDNRSDFDLCLSTEEKLQTLAQANAQGLAEALELTRISE